VCQLLVYGRKATWGPKLTAKKQEQLRETNKSCRMKSEEFRKKKRGHLWGRRGGRIIEAQGIIIQPLGSPRGVFQGFLVEVESALLEGSRFRRGKKTGKSHCRVLLGSTRFLRGGVTRKIILTQQRRGKYIYRRNWESLNQKEVSHPMQNRYEAKTMKIPWEASPRRIHFFTEGSSTASPLK